MYAWPAATLLCSLRLTCPSQAFYYTRECGNLVLYLWKFALLQTTARFIMQDRITFVKHRGWSSSFILLQLTLKLTDYYTTYY